MQPGKMHTIKGPNKIDFSSKSMTLAEGVVLRGIREMKSNAKGFHADLQQLISKPTKNPRKSWQYYGNLIRKYFDFSAEVMHEKDNRPNKLLSRNKYNKDLNSTSQWFFLEKYSPKIIRIWLTIPDYDKSTKLFNPGIFPVLDISHHSLSRIFYRQKEINSFNTTVREIICPKFLKSISVLAFGRESSKLPPHHLEKYLELSSSFSDMGIGTTVACVETRGGILLIRDPDQACSQPETGTLSEMFHNSFTQTVLVGATWVPHDKVRPEQLKFIRDTNEYYENFKSYVNLVEAGTQESKPEL